MGFFSYECRGCGHPLLSVYAVNHINNWMQHAVALDRGGVVAQGAYDGYGRVGTYALTSETDTHCCEAVWHTACWTTAGSPAFDTPSARASDQGYFFDAGTHDIKDPRAP